MTGKRQTGMQEEAGKDDWEEADGDAGRDD